MENDTKQKKKAFAGWMAALLAVAQLSPATAWAKIGLSSQFVDVVIEGMKPGRSYNLRELKGLPYTVKNRGDTPVTVQVEIVQPAKKDIAEGYVMAPDLSWFEVRPNRYRLGAGDLGFSDIIVSIPEDAEVGKHYMAQIWSHTIDTGMLAAGVKSNVRFSIGKGPETIKREKIAAAQVQLNYDLYPTALHVKKARVGAYDVKKEEKRSLILSNRHTEEPLALGFQIGRWRPSTMVTPAGYTSIKEQVDWVSFDPPSVELAPMSIQEVKLKMDIPEKYRGKKLAMVVELKLPIGLVVSSSHILLVTVNDDEKGKEGKKE